MDNRSNVLAHQLLGNLRNKKLWPKDPSSAVTLHICSVYNEAYGRKRFFFVSSTCTQDRNLGKMISVVAGENDQGFIFSAKQCLATKTSKRIDTRHLFLVHDVSKKDLQPVYVARKQTFADVPKQNCNVRNAIN